MKKKLQFLVIIITIVTFISSCTMEKRLYMPGYDVEWGKININRDKTDLTKHVNSTTNTVHTSDNNKLIPIYTNDSGTEENITASVDNSNLIIHSSCIIPKIATTKNLQSEQERITRNEGLLNKDSCDKIILKNGDVIMAKIKFIKGISKNSTNIDYVA